MRDMGDSGNFQGLSGDFQGTFRDMVPTPGLQQPDFSGFYRELNADRTLIGH